MIDLPIERERIKELNSKGVNIKGSYVLYWMQASQRVEYNHALCYAAEEAQKYGKPLVVFFGIAPFPEANERHYRFMLEGLKECSEKLEQMGIQFVTSLISPEEGAEIAAKNAVLAVIDRGYLRIQKVWREKFAKKADVKVVQVESDVLVPVETVSDKEEYSAATIRRKIWKSAEKFEKKIELISYNNQKKAAIKGIETVNIRDIDNIIDKLNIDKTVKKWSKYSGGRKAAEEQMGIFFNQKIDEYGNNSSNPAISGTSELSGYIHFGQISPVELYLKARERIGDGAEKFIEELIVRRELAINFVNYNSDYDVYEKISYSWALESLEKHKKDRREYIYEREELESAKTHDIYWNSAQREMVYTGKMHGYMRMYWAKKILEWSRTPEEAYYTTLYLNNRYFIDGRDPNGYAGIAWCYGKHDRAWKEREIFGKVRYMNSGGLERKFDIAEYVKRVNEMCKI